MLSYTELFRMHKKNVNYNAKLHNFFFQFGYRFTVSQISFAIGPITLITFKLFIIVLALKSNVFW